MAAVEVVQEPGHEVAAAVRASGRLEAWPRGSRRRSRALHPQHVRKWLYRATSNCALWARGGATHRQVGLECPAAARAQAGVSQTEERGLGHGARAVDEERGPAVRERAPRGLGRSAPVGGVWRESAVCAGRRSRLAVDVGRRPAVRAGAPRGPGHVALESLTLSASPRCVRRHHEVSAFHSGDPIIHV